MELQKAEEIAKEFINKIQDECIKVEVLGSIRRRKPQVKDIDLLIIPKNILFLSSPTFTIPISKRGEKLIRASYEGIQIDIYLANQDNWEVLKLIRTGSAEHNRNLCLLAIKNGWKLKANGEGLITDKGTIKTERGILEALLGKYIEPEDRN